MRWFARVVAVVVILLASSAASAWEVTLAWDYDYIGNPSVTGFYLYYRRPALLEPVYGQHMIDVGNNLMFLVAGMQYGLKYCFVATAHTADVPPEESGYSNEICVRPSPKATMTNPIAGTTVAGIQLVQVAVTDPDDVEGTQDVTFEINTTGKWIAMIWNAGSQRYEATWNTTGYVGQSVALTAIAVDPAGFVSDPTSTTVTVDNRLHIGNLDRSASLGNPYWMATVRIQVHDSLHIPVPNASVSGSWTNMNSGSSACITDGTGWCTVSAQIHKKFASTTFKVTNISGSYQASANHDPDGESNGTAITVSKP